MPECLRCGAEYDEDKGFCLYCDANVEPDTVCKKHGANCGGDDGPCTD